MFISIKRWALSENSLRTSVPNFESDSQCPCLCILQDCVFDKRKDDTALRVVYQGNFYLCCNNCCKRWFITFNGAECSGPLPIDVVWFIPSISERTHKPGAIEGYCDNIHKGKSVLVSTLETVLDMETLTVLQAGIHPLDH